MTAGAAGSEEATPWSAPRDAPRLLRHVALVTHVVPDVAAVAAAWQQYLDYRVVVSGVVDDALAAAWAAPAMAGRQAVTLAPASGASSWVRFIAGAAGGYGPPLTCGWNATELLVQDVDALAASLRGSPFRILGGPGDLYARPRAPRAMQVRGAAGELVYFTRLFPNGSRYGLHPARSCVDRPFIVTVGGRSSDAMEAFYGGTLGLRVMDRLPFINTILARACGVSDDTVFPTSVAPIPGRSFLVEMDQYPGHIADRPVAPGELPAGMAMVAFHVADLTAVPVPFRAPSRAVAGAGYDGRRVAVIAGVAGEWLELIETGGTQHG